jgi:Arc/MetJ family transcription regulator
MCRLSHMATNLAIDDRLLEEALRVGGHRTKKDTVTEALEEYIQRRKQARILDLFGKVEFDPKYDYKRQRRRS